MFRNKKLALNKIILFCSFLIAMCHALSGKGQERFYFDQEEGDYANQQKDSIDYKRAVINLLRDELNLKEILDLYIYLGIVDSTYLTAIPCINPIVINERPFITSLYGFRIHPIKKRYIKHEGIDLACRKGFQFIYATADGIVSKSGYNGGLGLSVSIKHPSGFETIYGHLSGVYVYSGSEVRIGTVIGVMGETGLAKGIHLHYAVKKNGILINPLPYLTLYQEFKQKKDALKASLSKSGSR